MTKVANQSRGRRFPLLQDIILQMRGSGRNPGVADSHYGSLRTIFCGLFISELRQHRLGDRQPFSDLHRLEPRYRSAMHRMASSRFSWEEWSSRGEWRNCAVMINSGFPISSGA